MVNFANGAVVPLRKESAEGFLKRLESSSESISFEEFERGEFLALLQGDFCFEEKSRYPGWMQRAKYFVPRQGAGVTFEFGNTKSIECLYADRVYHFENGWSKTAVRRALVPQEAVCLWNSVAAPSARDILPEGETISWTGLEWLLAPERQLIRCFRPESGRSVMGDFVLPAVELRYAGIERHATPHFLRDTHDFYRDDGMDPRGNFDWSETTLCHAFREKSKLFGGLSYAERLAESIMAAFEKSGGRKVLRKICEIGPGLGETTQAMMKNEKFKSYFNFESGQYIISEISPSLARFQREKFNDQCVIVENRDCFLLETDSQFDLVFGNEVLADLVAVSNGKETYRESLDRVATLLQGVLRPGGMVVLTEFCSAETDPQPSGNLTHKEIPINFEILSETFAQHEIEAEIMSLEDFMEADVTQDFVCGDHQMLAVIEAMLGEFSEKPLGNLAISKEAFIANCGDIMEKYKVKGIQYAAVREGWHFGPPFREFWVLVGSKSES